MLLTGTAACFGLSLAVAFRDPVWRLFGLGDGVDTLGQLEPVAAAGAVVATLALPVARTRQLGSSD